MNLPVDTFARAKTMPAVARITSPTPAKASSVPENAWFCPQEVRILVADDDRAICQLIQQSLARPSFRIEVAHSAPEAREKLTGQSYHLIILDYVLPGWEANEALEYLRQHQPDASVIVITGYPSLEGVVSCLRARVYDYLTKPFEIQQLEKVVQRCLQAKGLLRMTEEALLERIGAFIRDRRKALGLTLAQMSERTGVSLGYLSQIELGKNSASIETLYRICLGFGIRMSELFAAIDRADGN
ncbi:MAG: response regulator [Gemmatales bacterium]|nr:response regulator [Gemmatales bacterium]MCS7161414.1 response regulator [Gemmatales bacterium]MDW8176617.1 response regulator [Gemmatales bacterium]MDW8222005.1 response regulator [Gemmatales bacterium]